MIAIVEKLVLQMNWANFYALLSSIFFKRTTSLHWDHTYLCFFKVDHYTLIFFAVLNCLMYTYMLHISSILFLYMSNIRQFAALPVAYYSKNSKTGRSSTNQFWSQDSHVASLRIVDQLTDQTLTTYVAETSALWTGP